MFTTSASINAGTAQSTSLNPDRSVLRLLLATQSPTKACGNPINCPHSVTEQLLQLGLEINPENLSRLDQFPMNAVVSLGGCSASFVSPQGSGRHQSSLRLWLGAVQQHPREQSASQMVFWPSSSVEEIPTAHGHARLCHRRSERCDRRCIVGRNCINIRNRSLQHDRGE